MGQKYVLLNSDNFPQAFFDSEINTNIPADTIPITDEQWKTFLANQGRAKWNPSTSSVEVLTPPEPTFEELKQSALNDLKAKTSKYIFQYYPNDTQTHAIVSLVHVENYLASQNINLNALQSSVYNAISQHYPDYTSVINSLTSYSSSNPETWSAIKYFVKVSMYSAFVARVKEQYYSYSSQIANATSASQFPEISYTVAPPRGG